MSIASPCPLCTRDPACEIWSDDCLRVIDAKEPEFPGFTRVIWHEHVREMTDLSTHDRLHLMQIIWTVERVMRAQLAPVKINLAQFGNMVPHVHWHIIPRWALDSRFPDAIWAAAKKRTDEEARFWTQCHRQAVAAVPAYHEALKQALNDAAP